ncbi:MAG: hypothetical protein J5523_10310 [Muribaculaceae bacterium]|nr:hypothetical protein [Muribaculaceae bacterium]
MKRNADDERLAKLLKANAPDVKPNEWFTPRVLNKLPERRRSFRWQMPLIYGVAFVVCLILCIKYVMGYGGDAVTVRDVLYFVVMIAVTLYMGCQLVLDLVRE